MDINLEVLNWNIRGLNDPNKRDAVRLFMSSLHVNMVSPGDENGSY
jgi:hypothetical protein